MKTVPCHIFNGEKRSNQKTQQREGKTEKINLDAFYVEVTYPVKVMTSSVFDTHSTQQTFPYPSLPSKVTPKDILWVRNAMEENQNSRYHGETSLLCVTVSSMLSSYDDIS